MPFNSELFLKISQFGFLMNTLETRKVINEFEKNAILDGKNPPPRPPPSRPLTVDQFVRELAAREGVVIVGGGPSPPPAPP